MDRKAFVFISILILASFEINCQGESYYYVFDISKSILNYLTVPKRCVDYNDTNFLDNLT